VDLYIAGQKKKAVLISKSAVIIPEKKSHAHTIGRESEAIFLYKKCTCCTQDVCSRLVNLRKSSLRPQFL
jgi:hypothetical protein